MRPTEKARGAVAAMIILVAVTWARLASAAELPEEAAQRALRELNYTEARGLLEGALKSGGLSRERLITVRALLGEVVAAMDGPEAGEREFRRLLVLDPQRPLPSKKSPVIVAPFERARRWVAQNGSLKATAITLGSLEVEARVTADPLAMAAGARVYAGADDGELVRVPGRSLRAPVPAGSRAFYIEIVDEQDNVLLRLGSADEPFELPAPPVEKPPSSPAAPPAAVVAPIVTAAPPPPPRMLHAGIALGALSIGFLGAGIGLDRAAVSEYDALQRRCAPTCTGDDLGTFRLERNLSYASFALAGSLGVTAIVLIAVAATRARAAAHGAR